MGIKFPGTVRAVLVVAVAAAALVAVRDETQAITFAPTASVVAGTPVAGANGNTVITTDFSADGSIFSSILTFIPASFGLGECLANNPVGVTAACADTPIPDGAVTGVVDSQTTVGLLNGNCTNGLTPQWTMMDATTDTSETVTFHDDPLDAGDVGEQFEDSDGNGLPDGVDKYPEYLLRLLRDQPYNPFDPGASSPLEPIQRTYGQANVGGDDVSLQFVMFAPGTTINGSPMDPNWGFMSVLVIQDTGDVEKVVEPTSITDFCAPNHGVTTLYGITRDNPATAADEGGHKYVTFPAPGATGSIVLASSEYDADDDGIENTIDTCPEEGNPDGWNPKNNSNTGDADLDGIPDVCDPNDVDGKLDADDDGFLNRGDNCPLLVNANQFDLDRDDIGDVCDDTPLAPGVNVPAVIPWGAVFTVPKNGDPDCSGTVTSVDALMTLRYVSDIEPFAPCIFVGADADCDGDTDSVDALKMLRFVAGLSVAQQPLCTPLGQEFPT